MRRITLAALLFLFLAACQERSQSAPGSGELDTVDVAPPPDALVDPSQDPVARPHRDPAAISGVLPSDFPSELPTPEGASLVDYEEESVTFLVPRAPGEARSGYESRLRAAGWAPEAEGSWSRSDRIVAIAFARQGPSTRIEVRY